MPGTPAFWLSLCGFILCGKALEQGFEPCQQALFVAIPERHLDLATCQHDMDIGACWGFWQGRDCLTLRLSLLAFGWWRTGPIVARLTLRQLRLGQLLCT